MRKVDGEAPSPWEGTVSGCCSCLYLQGLSPYTRPTLFLCNSPFHTVPDFYIVPVSHLAKKDTLNLPPDLRVSNLIWCSLLWASHWPFLALLTLCWSTPLPRVSSGHLSSCSCISTSRSPITSHVSMPPLLLFWHIKKRVSKPVAKAG